MAFSWGKLPTEMALWLSLVPRPAILNDRPNPQREEYSLYSLHGRQCRRVQVGLRAPNTHSFNRVSQRVSMHLE